MADQLEVGEQLPLIDVTPEGAGPIIAAARIYKKHLRARLAASKKEVEQKQVVLDLVRKENFTPLEGGVIRFEHEGVTICVTPRDELVQIKEKEE